MFDEGLSHTFSREGIPAKELPEERAGKWRVSGYESCTAGPSSDEFPPLAGWEGPPREGEKTPAEINKCDPHPETIMAVPCVGEPFHLIAAKLASGDLRCGTCGLPPYSWTTTRRSRSAERVTRRKRQGR